MRTSYQESTSHPISKKYTPLYLDTPFSLFCAPKNDIDVLWPARHISLSHAKNYVQRWFPSVTHFLSVRNSEPHMRTLFTASHFWVAFEIQGLYCKNSGGACNAYNMRAIFVFAWSLTINTAQICNTYLSTNVFLFPLVFRHCLVLWNHKPHSASHSASHLASQRKIILNIESISAFAS